MNPSRLVSAAIFLWATAPGALADPAPEVVPAGDPALPRAHAHNDYRHDRPLLDALARGFCSVEADIFLSGGELRVGHSRLELRKGRTLESLYLKPLAERVQANQGHVHPQPSRFILLIDIKKDGARVYPVLDRLLERYGHLFSAEVDGTARPGPVSAILSGDRPRALVEADQTRYCSIDGRPPDLRPEVPSTLVPLVSDSWSNHFRWRGRGPMPEAEQALLRRFVAQAHGQGRLLRFWAAPDRPEAWKVLHEAGVDLINTDDLRGLSEYLHKARKE